MLIYIEENFFRKFEIDPANGFEDVSFVRFYI